MKTIHVSTLFSRPNMQYIFLFFLASVACLLTVLIGLYSNLPWLVQLLIFIVLFGGFSASWFERKKTSSKKKRWIDSADEKNTKDLFDEATDYCNDLIRDYEHNRYYSRRWYLFIQGSTILLTGLTPIIILIDTSNVLRASLSPSVQAFLPWAAIIFPAFASLLATLSTIFPFQEDWMIAKKTAESLEATLEEFILGASDFYRIDMTNPQQEAQQRKRALENFIIKINEIHLQHINTWSTIQRTEESGTRRTATVDTRRFEDFSISRPTDDREASSGEGSKGSNSWKQYSVIEETRVEENSFSPTNGAIPLIAGTSNYEEPSENDYLI